MAQVSQRALIEAILRRAGRTFAEEVGINVARNTPSPLFQLLFTALLLSARIRAANAVRAAKALIEAGLTTPRKMADASWQERVDVITWHGYKRYDERTSTMLGNSARLLVERYGGDLRRLREAAGRDVENEKRLLKAFNGIGNVGADIFLREVQVAWDEVYPYADDKVLEAARELGLPVRPDQLAQLVSRRDFARLASGLVRVELAHAYEVVRSDAH